MNNKKRSNILRWVVDEDKIILGPGRIFTEKSLFIFTISVKAFGAIIAVIFGSDLIFKNPIINIFALLIGSAIYLFGIQLNKTLREAKKEIQKRNEKLSKNRL